MVDRVLSPPEVHPRSAEEAREYIRRRYAFTSAVGRALTGGIAAAGGSAVVYGVWLCGIDVPIYIGQSTNARRRLWDLPIGESHHLSNTFPADVWDRVAVVQWQGLLGSDVPTDRIQSIVAGRRGTEETFGLALEFLLQRRYAPVFNEAKKKRDGSFRRVDRQNGRSSAALVGQLIEP